MRKLRFMWGKKITQAHTGVVGLEFKQKLGPVNSYACRKPRFLSSPSMVNILLGATRKLPGLLAESEERLTGSGDYGL